MNNTIKQIVSEHEDDSFFSLVIPSNQMINEAQEELDVKLPNEFVEYLKTYGSGGVGGVEILGYALDGSATFLNETIENRVLGLPVNLVVVEDVDEWVYCVDCFTGKVVSWSVGEGVRPAFSSFDEFVISEFSDAIENL